jgi:hypothetical protein
MFRAVNQKELCKTTGLDENLTTYFNRHTFATLLKTFFIPTTVIYEMIVHKTEAIT